MRRATLAAFMLATLSGCGAGDRAPAAPPVPVPSPLTDAERATRLAALPAPYREADLDNGARVFARCRACHTITPNGPNLTGPNLYGVIGRVAGTHPGYAYSKPLKAAGFAWDEAHIDPWLTRPRTFLPGNRMSFPGLPDAEDRRDVIAFLSVEAAKR
jgi:cytochrome c